MPYILPSERVPYLDALSDLTSALWGKPLGHLTYVLFVLARRWSKKNFSYTTISNGMAALRDAEAEIRERDYKPYEKQKHFENGDAI